MTKESMEFIAYHSNNAYLDKYKHVNYATHFNNGHINGYILLQDGIVYIFIAGTDDVKDIITDMRVAPSRFNGEADDVKVHVGFEQAYRDIKDTLEKYTIDEQKVIIAGHSMGGAIATLAAYKISKYVPDVTCVTFGCPRVGNRAFVKSFNNLITDSYRFVYRNDIVTEVPKLFWWYRHVDTLYQSKRKRWFAFFIQKVVDHPMDNYIDGIHDNMWKL